MASKVRASGTRRVDPLGSEREHRSFGIGARVWAGLAFGVVLVAGAGGWAATAQLSGAVIAAGAVAVDQNLKSIQHRDGGIVSEIAVREGDHVAAGQVLLRLDDAQTRAELSIVRSQLIELTAKRARLLAERDGLRSIEFPRELNRSDPETSFVLNGETRLFDGNRAQRQSQRQQLELQIEQIGDEMKGLEAQQAAKEDEFPLVEAEYHKLKGLLLKGLVEGSRVYNVERERTRLIGERGGIAASLARAKTRVSEIRVQLIAIDENARTEAQRELSLVETRLSEAVNRRMASEDRLSRTDMRAPISGTINELKVHTIGGVITPAEVLATIVPEDAKLKVEVKLAPVSIDQVAIGRPVRLKFTSFNQRTTPELNGELSYVSPATARDAKTGEMHYVGHIQIGAEELSKISTGKLLPGMPVEVFLSTEERTALSYFVKPVLDQFSRAFRER